MINGKKVLALIPARSGSKGLRGKNLIDLEGKPLVSWPIETALSSKFVDKVVVSTNSKKIATVARKFGADVPFIRPSNLATDFATSSSVVMHALEYFKDRDEEYDYLVMLEPTSPLTKAKDIDSALKELDHKKFKRFDSIVSVCKSESTHPIFCSSKSKTGQLKPFLRDEYSAPTRRQDLKDVFFFDGSFYISKINSFIKLKTFFHQNTLGYEMPHWQSYEIDTKLDLIIIKAILASRKK